MLCGLASTVWESSPVCFTLFRRKKRTRRCSLSVYFLTLRLKHGPGSSANIRLLCPERKREVVSRFFWFWWFAYSCAVRAHWRQTSVSKTWALLETIKLQKWIRKETHTLQTTHSIKPHKEYLFLAHNLLNSHTYKRAVLTSLDFRAIQWFRKIIWNWGIIEQHRIFFTWNS